MAAHLEPRTEDVDTFLALTDFALSREIAIKRLKGNNNNLEQAMNEYFEDPSSTKYHWDDSAFSSDRDGGMNNHGISFNIQSADDLGPTGGNRQFDGAPSRPPSRTSNNKSPLGKIIDLTAEHAMADPRMSMSTQDHQDRELRQALAESRKEAGLPPQEEGIIGVDEVHFGPANRSQYEQGKWEMVPAGKSSVQEIVVDPEPEERKRDINAPAFLKPSIANNRLNALITIYHEIPMTRNVFLDTTHVLHSYGHDSEWWSGTRIFPAQIHGDDDPSSYDEEVSQELQRLMAFLDKTERAYGSVDALASLDEVRRSLRQYADMESAVLRAWRNIYDNTNRSGTIRAIFSAGVPSESMEDNPKEFAILELDLPPKESLHETLYDIADEILWPGLGNMELADSPYLSRIADVIAFRVEGGEEHKRVEIPAVWYPDRYLKNAREAALEMRIRKRDIMDKLNRISWTENRLTHCPLQAGRMVKVKDLFDATLRHDEAKIENGVNSEEDLMETAIQHSRAAIKLSEELLKVMASIDKKLLLLAEAKEKAVEELKNLSKLYTEPSSDPNTPKLHKYTLRGVSTNKHTMYICRRAEPDLIDMDLDGDGMRNDGDQWWRIHYAPIGSSPVTVEKTSEIDVLHAAKHEGPNTLLVYASERAMNFPSHVLPKPLESFVHMDNRLFRSELPKSQSDTEVQSPDSQSVASSQVGPSSPGKRKYSEDEPSSSRTRRVTVTERELRGGDESNFDAARAASQNMAAGMSGEQGEMVIGVDPSLISLPSYEESKQEMQEMQERPGGGIPMLAGRAAQGQMSTIDTMDLDQVVEDEDVREESAAVKRVGFVE